MSAKQDAQHKLLQHKGGDTPGCAKIAHRPSLASFHCRRSIARNFSNGDHVPLCAWQRSLFASDLLYAEQMDAEGLGRKLLLTPSGDPRRTPEKQTVGTVDSMSKNAKPASTFELSQCRPRKGGAAWAEERLLGALRQSENGSVHLHS